MFEAETGSVLHMHAGADGIHSPGAVSCLRVFDTGIHAGYASGLLRVFDYTRDNEDEADAGDVGAPVAGQVRTMRRCAGCVGAPTIVV